MDVGVRMRGSSGYTTTSDFNFNLRQSAIPDAAIYASLGKLDGTPINSRTCERVDCMHPCYGIEHMGACNKCVMHLMKTNGDRHTICDLCVVWFTLNLC